MFILIGQGDRVETIDNMESVEKFVNRLYDYLKEKYK